MAIGLLISITILSAISFAAPEPAEIDPDWEAFDEPYLEETAQFPPARKITWDTTAVELRGRLDQDFTYFCPPNGRVGTVWGTDIYTDDSSICSAAVHSGLIGAKEGGAIAIRIRPGESSYAGMTRNGVSSQDYGSWNASFIFLNSEGVPVAIDIEIPRLGWNQTAVDLRGRLDQDFSYFCLPNGRVSSVWGTNIYTDDSSICSAAVHTGLITTKDGGTITIRIQPGESSYLGSTSNGVSSEDYGIWDGSFIFVD